MVLPCRLTGWSVTELSVTGRCQGRRGDAISCRARVPTHWSILLSHENFTNSGLCPIHRMDRNKLPSRQLVDVLPDVIAQDVRSMTASACTPALGPFLWNRDYFQSRSFTKGFSCKTALNSEL